MNLKDCYSAFNGNYDDVMMRIPREASVIKFLRKFKENGDFAVMLNAVENKNYEEVFATSHNIKGMSANLSISALCESVSAICEATRGGAPTEDISTLVDKAISDFNMTIAAIDQLED